LSATIPDPRRWQALAVLGVAYLMVVLDVSIVNVALPSIQTNLHLSTSGREWVVSGYALTFGGLLLLGGRSGDLLGRRRVFSRRTLTGANLIGLVLGTVVFGAFFLLPLYQQDVLGFSPLRTGVNNLAIAKRLSRRPGRRGARSPRAAPSALDHLANRAQRVVAR
jgi:MFS family permease